MSNSDCVVCFYVKKKGKIKNARLQLEDTFPQHNTHYNYTQQQHSGKKKQLMMKKLQEQPRKQSNKKITNH